MNEEKRGRGRPKTLPDKLVNSTLRLSRETHRQAQAAAGLVGVSLGQFCADAVAKTALDVLNQMGVDPAKLGDVIVQPQTENARKRKTEK